MENWPGGCGYPEVELRIASGDALTDWSSHETFIYKEKSGQSVKTSAERSEASVVRKRG